MAIDVRTEIDIDRPRSDVAAFAGDPDNVTAWYKNIESVEWKTPKPARVGLKLDFVAHFLGRRLAYTYEITELVPSERLVMRTEQGPFPMETTYEWRDSGSGTNMSLRNRGRPSGFSSMIAPFMAGAVKRANRKDLARLKSILEANRF